jgi:putative peptidoglycan lipid II flippase
LTGIYQAQARFSWSSAVPFFGALANLLLVAVLVQPLGVLGVAIAATTGITIQLCLLAPIAFGRGRFRPSLDWRHPGVRQMIRLLWPLVIGGLAMRWTPIVERYLASDLAEGVISQLGYALKICGVFTALLATGITTVVFPQMALDSATGDSFALRRTMSLGLRVMWLLVAPAIGIGIALASPLVTTLLQRGRFTEADASSVGLLFQIYMLSMIGGCLGNITGRMFYAMKTTRIIAIMGIVETLAYLGYTSIFVYYLGAPGLALGYTVWLALSVCWQLPVLRYRLGNRGGRTVLRSALRTAVAAGVGGGVAWLATVMISRPLVELVAGGLLGGTAYVVVLWGLGSEELRLIASRRS